MSPSDRLVYNRFKNLLSSAINLRVTVLATRCRLSSSSDRSKQKGRHHILVELPRISLPQVSECVSLVTGGRRAAVPRPLSSVGQSERPSQVPTLPSPECILPSERTSALSGVPPLRTSELPGMPPLRISALPRVPPPGISAKPGVPLRGTSTVPRLPSPTQSALDVYPSNVCSIPSFAQSRIGE